MGLSPTIRVLSIVRGTTVDGPGLRTSIYFSGCRHRCPGCHNPQSWDFDGGTSMTMEELCRIVAEEDFDVTLTGGDPLFHPQFMSEFIRRINDMGHSVWVYTGFTWEEIVADSLLWDAVKDAEALVEGRYIEELRDPDLRFRGSANQRIVYLDKIKLETVQIAEDSEDT